MILTRQKQGRGHELRSLVPVGVKGGGGVNKEVRGRGIKKSKMKKNNTGVCGGFLPGGGGRTMAGSKCIAYKGYIDVYNLAVSVLEISEIGHHVFINSLAGGRGLVHLPKIGYTIELHLGK